MPATTKRLWQGGNVYYSPIGPRAAPLCRRIGGIRMSGKLTNVLATLLLSVATTTAALTVAMPLNTFAADQRIASSSKPSETAAVARVGKPAPDFTLKDSNGKEHSLKDYAGKYVVVEWVNFDCPFVKKHYSTGNMQALQEKYTGKGVVWLSVNSSAAGKQGNFEPAKINELIKERKAHPTAYLLDSDGTVGHKYGAKATPHMFIVNPKGVLAYAGAIDDKDTTDAEDVKSAKNYVAQALDQALAGKKIATASTKAYGCSVKYAAP